MDRKKGKEDDSKKTKLLNIKYVPVEFQYEQFHEGESKINRALGLGYVVLDNFRTDSGVVVVMGMYGDKNDKS